MKRRTFQNLKNDFDNEDAILQGPQGVPSTYKPEYAQLAYGQCLLGKTNEQLAVFFDVNVTTIGDWIVRYATFATAIKRGKDIADAQVVEALFHRAKGYSHRSEEIKVVSDGLGFGSSVVRVPITKQYAPDPIAGMFWLKNRQPDTWREKQEIKHEGEITGDFRVVIVKPTED